MKPIITLLTCVLMFLHSTAQVSNIEIRVGGDLWRLSYTASSSQINCGLCPQIIGKEPGTELIISDLQDSVTNMSYTRSGLSLGLSASILSPAIRVEVQISPSMRKLNTEKDRVGRYVNRNISALIGINPMQLSEYGGKYYLGTSQDLFLDLSDMGVYAQFSYDGGFEEFVRSTNNVAILARLQPTLWLNDQKQFGVSLRAGGRAWLLGNSQAEGPFIGANGLPKKVKPKMDWFLGIAVKISPFSSFNQNN